VRQIILLIGIVASQFAWGSDSDLKNIRSWSDLVEVIKLNDVKTIDQLLQVLPSEFLQGHTMIYRSRALDRELVSERRPRVLAYGTDARFVMAYNSHVSGRLALPGDRESIETIEFTPAGAKLRVLDFDGIRSPLDRTIEVNAKKCTQCHGSDPKGFWDPYNHWSGVYGSLSRGFVDFIRIPTAAQPVPEYDAFLSFLEERKTNPRYAVLNMDVTTLSALSAKMDEQNTPLHIPFLPAKMMDAIIFKDGHDYGTNQLLGMYIGQENFARIGRSMASLPEEKRAAFQYLFKGISLDENYTVLRKDKKFDCLAKIDGFFPDEFHSRGFGNYAAFRDYIIANQQNDYNHAKAEVESRNLGLSKKGAGFSSEDPFDQDVKGRELVYDSTAADLNIENLHGRTGSSAIMYAFYAMGLPFDQFSTSANGNRYSLYYGSSPECYYGAEEKKGPCTKEDIETFVTRFVPKEFFVDKKIDDFTCDQLAEKSRSSLRAYIATVSRAHFQPQILR
jgi:hypothetical protein